MKGIKLVIGAAALTAPGFFPAAPAAGAASCAGNACTSLRFDAARCEVTNVGEGPISLSVPGGLTISNLAPGRSTSLRHPLLGCPSANSIGTYTVNVAGPAPAIAPPTGEAVALRMGFREPQSCSGNACGSVKLEVVNGCVWLRNNSQAPAAVDIHFADRSLTVQLAAAAAAPPSQTSTASRSSGPSASQCGRARNSQAMFDDLRKRGVSAPTPPEVQQIVAACTTADAAHGASSQPTALTDGGATERGQQYDAFSNTTFSYVRTKILVANACLATIDPIVDFVATRK